MRHVATRFVATLTIAATLSAPMAAYAQSAPPLPPPSSPSSTPQGNGEYSAPLSQSTQPTYVPQSVALSGPRMIKDWEEGDPIPPGYHVATRTRTGLIVGGAVLFGVLYFLSLVVAAGNGDAASRGQSNPAAALYFPVAGPFIQMANSDSSTAKLFLAIDGLGQAAGAAMFIGGLSSPKTVLLRNDLARPVLTPMRIGRDGFGLGLSGSF
jgi:hypothetical protein